jgi:DnaK suppressor protein
MSNDAYAAQAESLREQQATLRIVLSELEVAGKPVALDQALQGRISRIDAITRQEMAKAGRSHMMVQLDRIKAALERHSAGRYGLCCRCEMDIAAARLTADPATPFCVDCADEIAADNRQQARRFR